MKKENKELPDFLYTNRRAIIIKALTLAVFLTGYLF